MNAYEALELMRTPGRKKIILDTDTYNEVDDQFALAYAMLSDDRIDLLSVNAAPFLNSRSVSPADGMEKSYAEIFRIMRLTDPEKAAKIPVFRGSDRFTGTDREPVRSDACENIIETVRGSEETVFIVAVGGGRHLARRTRTRASRHERIQSQAGYCRSSDPLRQRRRTLSDPLRRGLFAVHHHRSRA